MKRKLTCEYETEDGESHSQALKRKHDDMIRSNEAYEELFQRLGSQDGQEANAILRMAQQGLTAHDILDTLNGKGDLNGSQATHERSLAAQMFLLNLAHSSGSLRDVLRLAPLSFDRRTTDSLPDAGEYSVLRNRVVHVPSLERMTQRASQTARGLQSGSTRAPTHEANGLPYDPVRSKGDDQSSVRHAETQHLHASPTPATDQTSGSTEDCPDAGQDYAPHNVPAAPWTKITSCDEAVSHLVSIFFAWINPTWRFVEDDLFLRAAQSKRPRSDFCSPFLFNSICAVASLHSEHDVAFATPGERITRGLHFHNEAFRLWGLEEYKPTLPNIQALCVLSLDSNYRAKDRLGLNLVPIAVQLDNDFSIQDEEARCARQGISARDFQRGRLGAHWAAVCTHTIMCIAFLSTSAAESRVTGLPKIFEVFDDKVEHWEGYPLDATAVPHRPTLYFRERCRLHGHYEGMRRLLFPTDKNTGEIAEISGAVDQLAAELRMWHSRLPIELQYHWPMSIDVWELHASYLAFSMILHQIARARALGSINATSTTEVLPKSDAEDSGFRSNMGAKHLAAALPLAHTSAQILRDFRQRYGLKITPAWLLQLQAVSAGVLMLDPTLSKPIDIAVAEEMNTPIRDSHNAFDEVFRCLLGTGVQVMIARGIARMMYHTAREQKIALSQSTRSMLQMMSSTAWRPSDLALVNSTFPNFATAKGHEDHQQRLTELLLNWERFDI